MTDDSEAQLSRRMPTRVIFQRPRKERELRREGCLFWAIALSPSGWLYCQLERDALARCLGRQISPAASLRTRPSNGDPITCPLILFQSFCTSIKWDVRRSSLLSPPSPGRPPSLPTSRIEHDGVLERRRQMSLVLSLSYQSPVLENEKETLARP